MSGADIWSRTDCAVGWHGELTHQQRRRLWARFCGWALDAMNVQMFSFAIPAIIASFQLTKADAGFIGTATLLTSALAAIAYALVGLAILLLLETRGRELT